MLDLVHMWSDQNPCGSFNVSVLPQIMCLYQSESLLFFIHLVFFASSLLCALLLLPSFFLSFCFSKTIQINIIDDEEYEKNKNFFLEIGAPQLLEMSERKGGGVPFLSCDPDSITNDL